MSWFVVATKPNAEQAAKMNLARQGFAPYLPQIKTTRRHARRVEIVKRPLFPGYIFVELDAGQARWRSINGTYGVRHILINAGRPQAVPDELVEALVAREQDTSGGILVKGDTVEVYGGPFDAQIGEVLSMDDANRVRLLLNLMGGQVISTLAAEQVQKVI